MLMKTGIFYFTTCFHGFGIWRHVDPFVRMLHICYGRISYDVREKCYLSQTEKTADNTLFTKIKVILQEK